MEASRVVGQGRVQGEHLYLNGPVSQWRRSFGKARISKRGMQVKPSTCGMAGISRLVERQGAAGRVEKEGT
jgi:hypothetical protein